MASRRRKKNCCNHRPPLEFINSPDDQDLRVLSPESAADNPLTARSVLPNETTEWVSPQFENTDQYYCQRSRRQSSRHAGSYSSNILRSNKFRPLRFIHENCQNVTKDNARSIKLSEDENHVDSDSDILVQNIPNEFSKSSGINISKSVTDNNSLKENAHTVISSISKLCESPTRDSPLKSVILAADTPKGDYALTHRQKQLKYRKYGMCNVKNLFKS